MADFVLLNKTDLVDEAQLGRVSEKIRALNPHTRILRTRQSEVPLDELLDIHAFDVDRKLEVDADFLNEMKDGRHHHDITSHSFAFEQPFDIERFEKFVQRLSEKEKVYRSKGFVSLKGQDRRAIFHGVNNRFHIFWDRAVGAGRDARQPVGVHRQEARFDRHRARAAGVPGVAAAAVAS